MSTILIKIQWILDVTIYMKRHAKPRPVYVTFRQAIVFTVFHENDM